MHFRKMKVAILGASPKPERYSYQAQQLLMDCGHEVFPVSLSGRDILGVKGTAVIPSGMDVVTIYLSASHLNELIEVLVAAAPQKVIFNPGSENREAKDQLEAHHIQTQEACTLVLLRTGAFSVDW